MVCCYIALLSVHFLFIQLFNFVFWFVFLLLCYFYLSCLFYYAMPAYYLFCFWSLIVHCSARYCHLITDCERSEYVLHFDVHVCIYFYYDSRFKSSSELVFICLLVHTMPTLNKVYLLTYLLTIRRGFAPSFVNYKTNMKSYCPDKVTTYHKIRKIPWPYNHYYVCSVSIKYALSAIGEQ